MSGNDDRPEQTPGPFDLTDEIGTRIGASGNAVDRTLPRDPIAAEPTAREEYRSFLEAEEEQERRLHKGHALHNIGVAIHSRRPDEARTYFHAAHVEDARSFPVGADGWGWIARRMLLELYGERLSIIEQLEAIGRASTEEPLALARRFEAEHGARSRASKAFARGGARRWIWTGSALSSSSSAQVPTLSQIASRLSRLVCAKRVSSRSS